MQQVQSWPQGNLQTYMTNIINCNNAIIKTSAPGTKAAVSVQTSSNSVGDIAAIVFIMNFMLTIFKLC